MLTPLRLAQILTSPKSLPLALLRPLLWWFSNVMPTLASVRDCILTRPPGATTTFLSAE